MELKDKVVVVTGASSGIGRSLSIGLAKKGAKVVLAARRREELDTLAREIHNSGGQARVVPTDVSIRSQIENLVLKSVQEFGRLDIFVNNAGVTHPSLELVDLPEAEVRRVLETNLMAAVYGVWEAVPQMVKTGGGMLVFVSSVVGKRGIGRNSIYCTSKFALQGLTESIRTELKSKKIHVLTVCPPGVDTPFFEVNKRAVKRTYRLHSSEKIAKLMIQAMEKEKREVLLTLDAKALTWGNNFFPGLMDWAIALRKGA